LLKGEVNLIGNSLFLEVERITKLEVYTGWNWSLGWGSFSSSSLIGPTFGAVGLFPSKAYFTIPFKKVPLQIHPL